MAVYTVSVEGRMRMRSVMLGSFYVREEGRLRKSLCTDRGFYGEA